MRCATNGEYPRYIVWENVPGAFSSNKGDDFRCVLESVCQIKDETAVISQPDKWQPAGEIVGDDLQAGVPEKYYLTPKACQGILRRASVRGKKLPAVLEKALIHQASA